MVFGVIFSSLSSGLALFKKLESCHILLKLKTLAGCATNFKGGSKMEHHLHGWYGLALMNYGISGIYVSISRQHVRL